MNNTILSTNKFSKPFRKLSGFFVGFTQRAQRIQRDKGVGSEEVRKSESPKVGKPRSRPILYVSKQGQANLMSLICLMWFRKIFHANNIKYTKEETKR